jgi:hypothetical protein
MSAPYTMTRTWTSGSRSWPADAPVRAQAPAGSPPRSSAATPPAERRADRPRLGRPRRFRNDAVLGLRWLG